MGGKDNKRRKSPGFLKLLWEFAGDKGCTVEKERS